MTAGTDPAERRRSGRARNHEPEIERRMILDAAYRVLARHRSGIVPIEEILRESGLSTRSFYRHFRSKDELFLAMFESDSARAVEMLMKRMDRAESPSQAVTAWVMFSFSFMTRPQMRLRMLTMMSIEVSRVAGYAAAEAKLSENHRRPLVGALAAGRADGSFAHTDPERDAVWIEDIVSNVLARWRNDVVRDEDRLEFVLDFVGRAIGSAQPLAETP